MPSVAFLEAKDIGREFELLMIPELEQVGFRVIDTDRWSYRLKKGADVLVEYKGERCGVEFKLDRLSEKTGNVVIDLDSLKKSTSGIWIFGLPQGNQIHTYSMRTTDLGPFALKWPIKRPMGEFRQLSSLVPKATFLGLDFVRKFKTIEITPA
jgi:hypothetical protein